MPRRHPHQVLVALLVLMSGPPMLAGGPRPGSISATLPPPLMYVWAGVLTFGGALVVAAALVRSAVTALYLELIADPPLALGCLTLVVAAFTTVGARAAVAPVAVTLAAAAAFAIRGWQVWRELGRLRHALAAASNGVDA